MFRLCQRSVRLHESSANFIEKFGLTVYWNYNKSPLMTHCQLREATDKNAANVEGANRENRHSSADQSLL